MYEPILPSLLSVSDESHGLIDSMGDLDPGLCISTFYQQASWDAATLDPSDDATAAVYSVAVRSSACGRRLERC